MQIRTQCIFFDRIGLTPTPRQSAEVERVAAGLSLSVLERSIHEIETSELFKSDLHINRHKIALAVYKKTLVSISLFSCNLFIFENIIRNVLSCCLAEKFNTETWWRVIENDFRSGSLSKSYIGFSADQKSAIENAIWKIDGDLSNRKLLSSNKLQHCTSGLDFLGLLDMAPLIDIAINFWSIAMMQYLNPGKKKAITKDNFRDQTYVILKARNDAYHHRLPLRLDDAISHIINILSYFGDFTSIIPKPI